MNPLIQGKSRTTPVMSRNAFSANQGTNEDDSQSDPHPEAGIFGNQTMRNFGQKDRRDMVTGVQREFLRPWHGDMSYRTDTQWPLHGDRVYRTPRPGDRSSERESLRPRYDDRSYRTDSQPTWHILLPWYIFRKAEKESPHKSTAIPQWKHPCDNWGRPNFAGASAIGK